VLEVREKSAEVLGGLLHCSFLPATDKLLELFKKKCRTKVIKRSNRVTTSCAVEAANASESDNLVKRHSGVLGLCAFITAYPYDIPEFVPNVFEIISNHLNDPQPIPVGGFGVKLIDFSLLSLPGHDSKDSRRLQAHSP
jgi:proteasome activator subunit 4